MALEHIPLKTTPTQATKKRQESKRSRQEGRALVSREVTELVVHAPRVPQNTEDIHLYKS